MKKLLSIVAIVVFFAAIAMPVSASTDEKPKKKVAKTEAQSDAKKEASKDCATPCGEKKAAACGEKKAAACGGEATPAPACGGKEKK